MPERFPAAAGPAPTRTPGLPGQSALWVLFTLATSCAMNQPPPNPSDITVKDGAWVLPAGCVLSRPDWRQAIDEHRARLRKQLGPVDRPESLQRSFTEAMVFLYERGLYDASTGRWRIEEFLDRGRRDFGGYDQVILWQSYPRLGLDERNQFDYYRDLPGGVDALAQWVNVCRARGVRVLLTYNPWDRHTREGDRHLPDMLDLLRKTGADGVYLDTLSGVPAGWTDAVASVGRPVAFESEGDPGDHELPAMHSAWGQGFTVSPPAQVLHAHWVLPCHKIFLTSDRRSRDHWDEVRCAFFNGVGVLVWENVFGNDTGWVDRDKALLRALVPIQRAFWRNFAHPDWQAFVPSAMPSIRIHRWPGEIGTLYTLCPTTPEPYSGPLLGAQPDKTYFDLITGRQLEIGERKVIGRLGCRSVGAILEVGRVTDEVRALLTKACPGELPAHENADTGRLRAPGQPVPSPRIGRYRNEQPKSLPEGMLWIPAGKFTMKVDHAWHGARCYDHPWGKEGKSLDMAGFAIDRFPVTNRQYAVFLEASGYRPRMTQNFLRHWQDGKVPAGVEDHPVVNVSLDDARAYASWAGKRLPTEAEWQYAAGGGGGRAWPWGDAFDPARCNPGGRTSAVGAFRGDVSPFGLSDLVGNVWQWTDDVYQDRVHTFAILKGGSFFRMPKDASEWYIHAGPCPLTSHVKVPLLAPSLDRLSTVGFRCVID